MGAAAPGRLWSTEELEWLSVRNQGTIDAWGRFDLSPEEHLAQQGKDCVWYCGSYMRSALEISDWGDACILFLCPEVVTPEGEWECWELATWNPGANRYPSFRDWFVAQLDHEW
jgi:hypothetical protein